VSDKETGGPACRRCGDSGPTVEFREGIRVCRKCESRAAVEWARKNREKKRAYNNAYHKRISAKRAMRTAAWRKNHPEAYACHKGTQTAIRNGTLIKQPCEMCGNHDVHAHHDDYSKPLNVRWLCHKHHMEVHAMLAERAK